MSLTNDSKFSSTSSYFAPLISSNGGSLLDSTVLITPNPGSGTARINSNVSGAGASGQIELGPTLNNPKALTVYDNGTGTGLNIASDDASVSGLNIVGPSVGNSAAYIRVNTSNGTETLTLGASATVNNNIVCTALSTSVNVQLNIAPDVDILMGGVLRSDNDSPNNAARVPSPPCASGDVANFIPPVGLIPGLYALTISQGADNGLYCAYYGSGFLYWDGTNWTSGGFNSNPGVLNGMGVRIPATTAGNLLTFGLGSPTPPVLGLGGVFINFRLIMAGPSGQQLAPFL